ncbi:hypothetical protein [Terrimonas pollutisoli]|uniref:hypothetical protein n=1 Tax=Terrimonas pollutisoli TaxID=3034147 RepID=UPI0023EC2A5F|nr:hypothetical protein [Terrimonas sp. H1YJ31]
MKKILFISLLFSLEMYAQKLTLLPQVGFENTKTSLNFNDLSTISPMNMNFTPHAGIRLDYQSKKGFGPYIGVSTTRPGINFRFTDAENVMNSFSAVAGNMQVRLESGLQYSIKPITLGKSKNIEKITAPANENKTKSNCGRTYLSSRCGSKATESKKQPANQRSWVSIQPALGFAYVPTAKTGVISKTQGGQTIYEYRAGYHNAAFTAGAGFEFGKNSQRIMTATISYFNGIGNLNEESITTSTGTKPTTTIIKSDVSGWNLKVGIPFTLAQKKQKPVVEIKQKSTQEYKGKCGQYRIIYKSCHQQ